MEVQTCEITDMGVEPCSTRQTEMIIICFSTVWVPEVGNTADTSNPLGKLSLLKEIWESPRVKFSKRLSRNISLANTFVIGPS